MDLITKKINHTIEKKSEIVSSLGLSGNPTWGQIKAKIVEKNGIITDNETAKGELISLLGLTGNPTWSQIITAVSNSCGLTPSILSSIVERDRSLAIVASDLEGITKIGHSAFKSFSLLTSIEIPSGVTSIGDYAFENCSGLVSVTIPSSVKILNQSAFSGCSSLTSVTIPGVTYWGMSVFYLCQSLTTVTILDGATSIGDRSFQGCTSLTSITIPSSVTNIGNFVFNLAPLTTINFNGTQSQWTAITKAFNWNNGSSITTIHCTDGDITL